MEQFMIGYVMGLITGEGSFSGDKRTASLSIKLHENDPEPLLLIQRALGGRVYGPYVSVGRHFHSYFLRGKALLEALPLFDEYLPQSRKREQFLAWRTKYETYLTTRIVGRPLRPARAGSRVIA